jgi:hypothetical protein
MKEQKPKFGEWISVKDRLPESIGNYICYIHNEVTTMGYDADIPQSNDIWQNRITHWMPFPQPPKGK